MNIVIQQGQRFRPQLIRNIVRQMSAFRTLNVKPSLAVSISAKQSLIGQKAEHNFRFCHSGLMKLLKYDVIVSDTLEDLADHFDYLADENFFGEEYDCVLADGVMTVYLGGHGTYVINKQTPNRQIWLSSPVSGPKRYDFIDNAWVYSHEPDRTLHDFLSEELSDVLNEQVDFSQLSHAKCIT